MVTKQSGSECDNMKTRRIFSLIAGTAFIALNTISLAAGHGGGGFGGGGGFHGGGFGGGGGFHGGGFGGSFHGGGFRAGGFAGGVGMRGGGVGFGGTHSSGSVRNFAGAGSRFSSFGRPSSRQSVYDGRASRSVTSNISRNRS